MTGAQGGTVDRTLWIFGGEGDNGVKNTVWSMNFDDLHWVRHPDMPTERAGGRAVYDGTSAFIVVGGCAAQAPTDAAGAAGSEPAADEAPCAPVIRFDIETQTWTPLAAGPGNRMSAGLAMDGGTLWLYGGVDAETGAALTDVWSYLGGWTSLGEPRQINTFEHLISGATLAATGSRVTTLSGGLLTSWESGTPQAVAQIGDTTMQTDCMWLNDEDAYIWSDGDVQVCANPSAGGGAGHCESDATEVRSPAPGAVCGPVDATLWTFGGGGTTDTGGEVALNNELWRYHDTEWQQELDGAEATSTDG